MFTLPAEKTDTLHTIGNAFKLFWKTLPATLPLSILATLLTDSIIFIKYWWGPAGGVELGLYTLVAIILMLAGAVCYGGIFAVLGNLGHGEPIRFSQAIAVGMTRLGRMIAGYFIVAAPFLLGLLSLLLLHSVGLFILFFLFFIWLAVYLAALFPLIINDNLSMGDAVKTSFKLVKQHWWYSAATLVVVVGFNIGLQMVVTRLFGRTATAFSGIILSPLHIAALIVLLDQLKIRDFIRSHI